MSATLVSAFVLLDPIPLEAHHRARFAQLALLQTQPDLNRAIPAPQATHA